MATDLGKVGIVMKGVWSNSATYEVLDAVSYNGGLYVARQAVPANTAPTNSTYWQNAVAPIIKARRCRVGNGATGAIPNVGTGTLVVISRAQSFTKGLIYIDTFGAIVELISPSNVTLSYASSTLTITNTTGSNLDVAIFDNSNAEIEQY